MEGGSMAPAGKTWGCGSRACAPIEPRKNAVAMRGYERYIGNNEGDTLLKKKQKDLYYVYI